MLFYTLQQLSKLLKLSSSRLCRNFKLTFLGLRENLLSAIKPTEHFISENQFVGPGVSLGSLNANQRTICPVSLI